MFPAHILVADPPWSFDDALPGPRRGARKHYRCMTVDDIAQFPLPPLAAGAVLFLWRVAAMQQDALHVVQEWGFHLKAELVWEKTTVNGLPHMGLGHIVRGAHETCLIATKGRPAPPRAKNIRSRFSAPVGRHSAKPEAFYQIVEALYPGPYVELFGRRRRSNWTVLGNEVR